MFSLSGAVENFRRYLLIRTGILQSMGALVKHKFKENENIDVFGTLAIAWNLFFFVN